MNKTKLERKSETLRKTNETDIKIKLDLDGTGNTDIDTGIPFFDHMLDQLGRHSFCDLAIKAVGDLEVDFHHTVEDVGIALGKVISAALGDRRGIMRYGSFTVPMDEALVEVYLDLSNRPYLVFKGEIPPGGKVGNFDSELIKEFFQALANNCGMTLHVNIRYGGNTHHIIEAMFKAFAKAFFQAITIIKAGGGIPSTKGKL